MEKLPHPYKLTHKITKKKMEEAFCGGFPRKRQRREKLFSEFLRPFL